MAVCSACQQEMTAADACIRSWENLGGQAYDRIRYGDEKRPRSWGPPPARCGDCNVSLGGFHHPGCDLERCPRCANQLLMCGCTDPVPTEPLAIEVSEEGEEDWFRDDEP
jgi:hypothetical protein